MPEAKLTRRRRARRLTGAIVVAAVALQTAASAAKLCGDDVDGRDVPCACGDVLVSGLVLADDPIAGAPCADDGLIVRPASRNGVTIDLRGRTLRGSGRGAGLRVVADGGVRIVSSGGRAQVNDFEDGIVAHGGNAIALIEDVIVDGARRDGMRVSADEFEIRRCETRGVRRDGFSLGGRGFQISATRALDSGRYGYAVMGESGTIGLATAGNVAEGSRGAGFNVTGSGHTLINCAARDGDKVGVHLQAVRLDVSRCEALGNGGAGISGVGSGWRMANNLARDNRGDGIDVRGPRMTDAGGNHGQDNGGSAPAAVQCEISGTPCAS